MKIFRALCILILAYSCSPATTTATLPSEPADKPKPIVDAADLSPCKNWLGHPNQSEAEDNHVLYRDEIRQGNLEAAFPMWQKAFAVGPAADGRRDYHYTDGVKLYAQKYRTADSEAEKREAFEMVESLYEQAAECYPENNSKYLGLLAFDYYYTFGAYVDESKKYDTFKRSFDLRGDSAHYFTINPFTALLIDQFINEKVSMKEAQKYVSQIKNSIAYGFKHAKNSKQREPWDIISDYAPIRLEELEGVEEFYDCQYFKDKYLPIFEADPENCENVSLTYGRLNWGKCDIQNDPDLKELLSQWNSNCKPKPVMVTPTEPSSARKAYTALQEGRYNDAVSYFDEAREKSPKEEKKATYALINAKIYYAHLKKFTTARQYARQSLEHNPNSGEAYILIGKLYASSGPLCGPGRGWDSQIVTWPAIDKWQKAKSVDPSVASEANQLIRRYQQYMPSTEDIFQRTLQEGASFRVGCWIQENTKIRATKG